MKDTILCVDDEQIVRDSLKEQLKRAFGKEARIEAVETGEAALEVVEELQELETGLPVVIADHIMPGLNGDELLCEIHTRLPRTLKIMLTGQASAEAVGNAVNHGSLYRYIGKPWDRDDLVLTVREALRSYYRDRRLEEQNTDLRQLTTDLERKSRTFYRFVPREFLNLLGVDDAYENVQLGMGVDRWMGILFADIRDFTPLCESLSTAQCVDFVNSFLEYMEEPIVEYGGFVEGFAGDAIMTMFDGGSDPAVRAGIGMSQNLQRFNEERSKKGHAAIRIGIGINAGQLTLGAIGAPSRIKCGVVGDPVNHAARVESLTKVYQCVLLISHHVRDDLNDESAYSLRQVDRVQVKGRTQPVDLFEVLEAESLERREARMQTLERYQEAITHYYSADFIAAAKLFAECLVSDPTDNSALNFLARCRHHSQAGVTADWSGVERLDSK